MFNGQNASGKEFDVVNEDGEVIGSFDNHADAATCGRKAHWTQGTVNIRRDREIVARRAASHIKASKRAMSDFYMAYC